MDGTSYHIFNSRWRTEQEQNKLYLLIDNSERANQSMYLSIYVLHEMAYNHQIVSSTYSLIYLPLLC